jgi:glutathione synthase/RimK-type ligase-like ATP-grasp enzyme
MAYGRQARILAIVGADRDDQIKTSGGKITLAGSSDFHLLLDPNQPFHVLQVTPQMLRQKRRPDFSPYDILLNLITEPERNERVLETLQKLLRGVRGKVINPPDAILKSTRDQIARRLCDVPGLLAPKAIRLTSAKPSIVRERIEQAGLRFPLILRQVATHTGHTVSLVDDLDDLVARMEQGIEHIATQFVDFQSADGIYRKYRVYFIGPHVVYRHAMASDHWNVHGKDRIRFMMGRPDLIDEEKALFAQPDGAFPLAVKQVFAAVRERIELDYFGLDFGIMPDGRVVLFEANATMTFYAPLPGPEFDYLRACLPPARAAFRELVGQQPIR